MFVKRRLTRGSLTPADFRVCSSRSDPPDCAPRGSHKPLASPANGDQYRNWFDSGGKPFVPVMFLFFCLTEYRNLPSDMVNVVDNRQFYKEERERSCVVICKDGDS
jgi:hypothetical protein